MGGAFKRYDATTQTWLTVGATGPEGPPGPQGEPGPEGPTGVVDATVPLSYDVGTQTLSIATGTTSDTVASGDHGHDGYLLTTGGTLTGRLVVGNDGIRWPVGDATVDLRVVDGNFEVWPAGSGYGNIDLVLGRATNTVRIPGLLRVGDGSTLAPALAFANEPDTGWLRDFSDSMEGVVRGEKILRLRYLAGGSYVGPGNQDGTVNLGWGSGRWGDLHMLGTVFRSFNPSNSLGARFALSNTGSARLDFTNIDGSSNRLLIRNYNEAGNEQGRIGFSPDNVNSEFEIRHFGAPTLLRWMMRSTSNHHRFDGDIYAANNVQVDGELSVSPLVLGGSINTKLESNNSGALIRTNHGFGIFGPRNTSFFHMDTDRPRFYFYKSITAAQDLTVNGNTTLSNPLPATSGGTGMTSDPGYSRRERASTAQSITDSSTTTVSFNTLKDDSSGSYFSDDAASVTISTPGVYRIETGVVWSSNSTGYRLLIIRVGGVLVAADRRSVVGFPWYQTASTTIRCSSGDVIRTEVNHNAGVTLTLLAADATFRAVTFVRP